MGHQDRSVRHTRTANTGTSNQWLGGLVLHHSISKSLASSGEVSGVDKDDVFAVLDALSAAGIRYWIAGGWGVDALLGRQTRPHRDLDLAVDAGAEALTALAKLGYLIETDQRPVRVEAAAVGDRWVDLHPINLGADGAGWQADFDGGRFTYPVECFVTGTIAGRDVPCLSAEQQIIFHSGYEPRAVDRHDIALLESIPRGSGPGAP